MAFNSYFIIIINIPIWSYLLVEYDILELLITAACCLNCGILNLKCTNLKRQSCFQDQVINMGVRTCWNLNPAVQSPSVGLLVMSSCRNKSFHLCPAPFSLLYSLCLQQVICKSGGTSWVLPVKKISAGYLNTGRDLLNTQLDRYSSSWRNSILNGHHSIQSFRLLCCTIALQDLSG